MKTRILTFLLLFIIPAGLVKAQSVGENAPDFTVSLSGGGEFELSDHQGKVVMIFFFGNGCPYCISSGPEVQGIYNTYKNDANFVAVGLDTWNASSSEETVSGFREETGLTFQLALSAGAVEEAYSTTYDRLAVIDQEGVLRHKGTVPAINDIENTSSVISGLLNETGVPLQAVTTGVQVFPNPAYGNVQFFTDRKTGGPFSISIYDGAGKQVYHNAYGKQEAGEAIVVDLDGHNGGLYIYRFQDGSGTETGKFILDPQ